MGFQPMARKLDCRMHPWEGYFMKFVQFSTWYAKSVHSGEESTFELLRFFFRIISKSFVNFTNGLFHKLYLHHLGEHVEQL